MGLATGTGLSACRAGRKLVVPVYPLVPSFVRSFVAAIAVAIVVLASSGCRRPVEDLPGAGLPDSLAAVVLGVRDDAFREAFPRLAGYSHTRYTRTEQFDGDDYLVAFRERVARIVREDDGARTELVSADSGGDFRFGFFRRFVSNTLGDLDPVDLAPYVLSDDPEYLRARNRARYEFRALPDTLLWDTQARVIEVRARPELGDGLNIRRVRYYVNRASNELVAMYLERIDLALLFREESRFYVHMRPVADSVLLPYNSRFDTRIRTPFRRDQRFRTVSTYYEFDPAGPRAAADTTGAAPTDTTRAASAADARVLSPDPEGSDSLR